MSVQQSCQRVARASIALGSRQLSTSPRWSHTAHKSMQTKPTVSGSKWSTQEMATLQAAASNFSSSSQTHHRHSHSHGGGLFGSHSHSHSHSGEPDVNKAGSLLDGHHEAGSRITLIGMGANVGMSVAKGIAGVCFHSSALLADAAHSMSDILGDLVTLYTFRKSRKPMDVSHPYGYGRYEALGTLFVSAFLVAAGVAIGSHALEQAMHFLPDILGASSSSSAAVAAGGGVVESAKDILGAAASSLSSAAGEVGGSALSLGHTHSHAAHTVVDGAVVVDPRAIWFAVGSIAINEVLFQATMKVGKRTKSSVLVANAWHHRSDALTSLVSVGAIGGAIMGFPILDALGGLVVSTMLAKSGLGMTMEAISEITDTPPPQQVTDEVVDALQSIIVDNVSQVQAARKVQCRKSGPFVHVSASLVFSPNETAADIEHCVSKVRQELRTRLQFVQSIDINIETDKPAADV
ncbi:mitochondrial metal transporter [Coemansia sp. Benny D115]|nr:mitochondrial metal transporter [Coemansia sp. Benny D115]